MPEERLGRGHARLVLRGWEGTQAGRPGHWQTGGTRPANRVSSGTVKLQRWSEWPATSSVVKPALERVEIEDRGSASTELRDVGGARVRAGAGLRGREASRREAEATGRGGQKSSA